VPDANPQDTQSPSGSPLVLGPQFMRVYANVVKFGVSLNDMTIFFGETFLVGPRETVTEERVSVTISLPQAKVLAGYLVVNLLNHELFNESIIRPQKGSFGAQFADLDTKLPVDQLITQMCQIVHAERETTKQ
jgi:hypothetical protein